MNGKFEGRIPSEGFDGKLVDQDPADEPVTVLLARIRVAGDATSRAPRKQRSA